MPGSKERLDPSAARTTTGTGAVKAVDTKAVNAFLAVNVTAIGGTPNLVLSLQWSHDGTIWFTADPADAMTAITGVGAFVKGFTIKAPFCRTAWTITGSSPSLTYTTDIYTI